MSLQSRFVSCREGNPGEKIPTGTRSRLWNAQRVLDSKIPHQAPADSKVPFGKFSPSFLGQVVGGNEDREGCCPVRHLQRLIVSFVKYEEGIVAATIW